MKPSTFENLCEFPTMSNLIPPMISDSPPPLDVEVDDNDDDDGFGDFRVAADLAFDLSDTSVGRDSPDVWNTPSTYSEPSDEKIAKLGVHAPSKDDSEKENVEMVNGVDAHNFEDPPEVIQELESIPFEFQSCHVELEKRTSPEGADDESCRAGFSESVRDDKSDPVLKADEEDFCQSVVEDKLDHVLIPDEDDFGDFAENVVEDKLDPVPDEEDFGDFADFASNQVEAKETVEDDDFDDFEFAAPPVETPTTEDEDLGQKLSAIFEGSQEVSLPSDDPLLTGCLHSCLDDSSSVWGHLKDLETSHALALQWPSSSASKRLLSSLNVDSRNIRWNSSMPRFAANLGCAPLEPMKAAVDETEPIAEVARLPVPSTEDVVPAAQFDWNSSGLTNPLDCMDKEETPVPKQPSQEIRTNPPIPDVWESPVPVSDILLPSPVAPEPPTPEPSIQPSQELWPELITVSSQLKEAKVEPTISEEARRVVEALPDLSFLSAKKLLYAANANRSRFQALTRP